MSFFQRVQTRILLTTVYGFTWLVATIVGKIPRRQWKPSGRIMVTGTFHNPNWYLSHITPLTHCGAKEVVLVIDEPMHNLDGVRFACPPRWLARLIGRAGAKGVWMIVVGLRCRPDLYMGYHLLPGGCSALIAGRLLNRPSCYQMTGGPVQIIGGGYRALDSPEGKLGRPSLLIERLALRVVRHIDLVVVRGRSAQQFVLQHNRTQATAIITGSVNTCKTVPQQTRDIDLIYVGRLAPIKQVDQVISIVERLRQTIPGVRAAIVGDGPSREELQICAKELGLEENIEFLGKRSDVESLMARSKIFVLTSQSEGLSIAMAEAMVFGAVPVVADVGELADLVKEGRTGYLIEPDNIAQYAQRARVLLTDDALRTECSQRAEKAAGELCAVNVIASKWSQSLRETISRASSVTLEDVWN